jgi:hypothetical protein
MSIQFINGGAPNYAGASFTSTSSLISLLETTFLAAGWSVVSKTSTILSVSCTADCTVVFTRSTWAGGPANGYGLSVTGLHSSVSSPTHVLNTLYYVEGITNYLWGAIDQDSGVLATVDSVGVHFGYLDRPNPSSDRWGWMIGNLSPSFILSNDQYPGVFYAKSFLNSTNWKSLSNDFRSLASTSNIYGVGAYWGVSDRYTTCIGSNPSAVGWAVFSTNSNTNVGFNSNMGQINGVDLKPVLGEYYYVEGRESLTAYGSAASYEGRSPLLYFRGNVKHCVVGMSSLSNKSQVIDSYGRRFISSGSVGVQGFRIL